MAILWVSCLASYLIVSDVAMVNVALPSIADALQFTPGDVLWFLACYALAFSALPLFVGRVADRFGHFRVFAVGVAVFSSAACVSGCAPSRLVLEGARAVQGVGGAIVAATALSLLTVTFTEPAARRRALAAWSATVSGGAAAGVLLGGVITAELGWRWVFLVSAAIGGVCLLLTMTHLSDHGARTVRARHLDLPGGLLISLGLGSVVLGLSLCQSRGWGSGSALALLAGGGLVLVLFLAVESRSSDPLLPIDLVRSPGRLGANVVTAVVGADLYFLYFAISVYLQRVDGNGPLMAGVKTLPAALAVVTGALGSTWIARRTTPRRQLIASMVVIAIGFGWLSRLHIGADYWADIGLPLFVIGVGFGTSFVPAIAVATSGVGRDRAGVASGLVNSSRQLGRALGLASLSGLALASAHPKDADRIVTGDSHAFLICASAALVAVVVVLLLIPRETSGGIAAPSVPQGAAPPPRDPAQA